MPLSHKDRVKQAVTTGGTGALVIGAASSGYQALGAGDDGKLFPYVIEDGVDWETGYGTYTHSGTSFARTTRKDSSTGAALNVTTSAVLMVDWIAALGAAAEGWLAFTAAGADAAPAMAVNTFYYADISGYTAHRTATLPATAAVGDRIAIKITVGDPAFSLLITATAGDTLDGVAGGTEWSRLLIAKECVTFRCIVANTTWIVEEDGRIPQQAKLTLTTLCDGESAVTNTRPTAAATPGAWTAEIDNASLSTVATDRITVRRAGNYLVIVAGASKDNTADQNFYKCSVVKNGSGFLAEGQLSNSGASTSFRATASCLAAFATDDYGEFQYRTTAGAIGCAVTVTQFSLQEVL